MRHLLTPRWLAAHVFVLAVGTACIMLGAWQLDRLEERRTANAVQAARFEQEPLPLTELILAAGEDSTSLEYRRTTFTGVFEPEREVLVRSQVRDGRAGFDVITPLAGTDATVLVNRGWVPLEFDQTPVAAAPPPAGTVTVEGIVRPSQVATAVSPDNGAESASISRVDVALLENRLNLDLLPVYVEVIGVASATQLPLPANPPTFTDDGPHLNYAIQWFSFAVVAAVGYGFLLRRAGRTRSGGGEPGDDLDAGQAD
ncbi:MAG TPA: SURF1 family protein [Acidimicrobiia bacterium]|nr:SURF1 family protein [Acidimicrobiia bacterium]